MLNKVLTFYCALKRTVLIKPILAFMKHILYLIPSLLLLLACSDDEGPNPHGNLFVQGGGFFVSNEGTEGADDASLSYYALGRGNTEEKIFQNQTGLNLGQSFNSISLWGEQLYLVVSQSDKVEVVNVSNFQVIDRIFNLPSPRYLLPVSKSKAYLSSQDAQQLYILNLETHTLQDSISSDYWTEEMVLSRDRLFVTQRFSDQILVVDRYTDQIIDSVAVAYDPVAITADQNGAVWVLSKGETGQSPGGLSRIAPLSLEIELSLDFPTALIQDYPRLVSNQVGDKIYFLDGNCYEMSINSATLPTTPFINAQARIFYGLGWEPELDQLILSHIGNGKQKGLVYRFDENGILVDSARVGIRPGNFQSF